MTCTHHSSNLNEASEERGEGFVYEGKLMTEKRSRTKLHKKDSLAVFRVSL